MQSMQGKENNSYTNTAQQDFSNISFLVKVYILKQNNSLNMYSVLLDTITINKEEPP